MFLFTMLIIVVVVVVFVLSKNTVVKGHISEKKVERMLKNRCIIYNEAKVLSNLYIPIENGQTTEIDLLYITSKGLIVIENKDYAGYIFGNENHRNWTVTLYGGKSFLGLKKVEKHSFYNPIWQNNTHIKHLKKFLKYNSTVFSIVAFSNRGEFKDINYYSNNVFVLNHSHLKSLLNRIHNENPDVLTENQIHQIFDSLLPLTNADNKKRQEHISNIHSRINSSTTCPRCGANLVIRESHNGPTKGSRFYGCSNYPKCRFTKNI